MFLLHLYQLLEGITCEDKVRNDEMFRFFEKKNISREYIQRESETELDTVWEEGEGSFECSSRRRKSEMKDGSYEEIKKKDYLQENIIINNKNYLYLSLKYEFPVVVEF